MKFFCVLHLFFFFCVNVSAQERVFPIIKNFGGIYEVPDAVEKPNPTTVYKIVIELVSGVEQPSEINTSLNNVARLINLHAIGGVPAQNIQVIVAIHGEAAYTVMTNETYRDKYKVDNPNIHLYRELTNAGTKFFICGQSLIARKIDRNKMLPNIKIATAMLTVVSTYQLQGYAYFKF